MADECDELEQIDDVVGVHVREQQRIDVAPAAPAYPCRNSEWKRSAQPHRSCTALESSGACSRSFMP